MEEAPIAISHPAFREFGWDKAAAMLQRITPQDVKRVLAKGRANSIEDFAALISPQAAPYLEQMAQISRQRTLARFGKTVNMFIPMYLSNECQNICTYCGFSFTNKVPRRTLTDSEILQEAEYVKSMGYDSILLVSGEASQRVGLSYFIHAVELIKPLFAHIAIEVQPLSQDDYQQLKDAGVHTVLVYQETYRKETYRQYHPKGKKSNFEFRLETADRLGRAGMHKIGIGVLLGLEDWRVDSLMCATHLLYLRKKYWQSRFTTSFPRLRPAEGAHHDASRFMTDREMIQLICAYRFLDENLDISISTRESEPFRDNIFKIGATSMSAGSKTDPGGYTLLENSLEQFEIHDKRSPEEIAKMLYNAGYEPVWKDWDPALSGFDVVHND